MSRPGAQAVSLLDRLHPDPSTHRASVSDRIRRDLEELLNSRKPWLQIPADQRRTIEGDVLQFGLHHVSELSLEFQTDERRLIEIVGATLRQFESRMMSPHIELDMDQVRPSGICFRIRSMVRGAGGGGAVDLEARLVPERHRYAVDTHR